MRTGLRWSNVRRGRQSYDATRSGRVGFERYARPRAAQPQDNLSNSRFIGKRNCREAGSGNREAGDGRRETGKRVIPRARDDSLRRQPPVASRYERNASAGCTPAARRAGSQLATITATTNTTTIATSVAGSDGATP